MKSTRVFHTLERRARFLKSGFMSFNKTIFRAFKSQAEIGSTLNAKADSSRQRPFVPQLPNASFSRFARIDFTSFERSAETSAPDFADFTCRPRVAVLWPTWRLADSASLRKFQPRACEQTACSYRARMGSQMHFLTSFCYSIYGTATSRNRVNSIRFLRRRCFSEAKLSLGLLILPTFR